VFPPTAPEPPPPAPAPQPLGEATPAAEPPLLP
jgi:hypothetical protein